MVTKYLKILLLLVFINTTLLASNDRALKYIKQYKGESKVALVIGNSSYKHFAKLKNAKNDAYDMKEILKKLGFEVLYVENGTLREMKKSTRAFSKKLSHGGVGMFYYAGHGIEVEGKNYLIPINANIPDKNEVEYETLAADMVIDKMEDSNNRLNIVVLDACRNDPFSRGGGGLAQINSAKGMYISYATAPGEVASDGSGRNGLFTKHLIKNINQPNQTLNEVFKQTRMAVYKESKERQLPWSNSSVIGDFYFKLEENKLKNQTSSFSFTNAKENKFTLNVNTTPQDAKVQITNIKAKYYDGIKLKQGVYKIKVSKDSYVSKMGSVDLKDDVSIDITLDKEKKNSTITYVDWGKEHDKIYEYLMDMYGSIKVYTQDNISYRERRAIGKYSDGRNVKIKCVQKIKKKLGFKVCYMSVVNKAGDINKAVKITSRSSGLVSSDKKGFDKYIWKMEELYEMRKSKNVFENPEKVPSWYGDYTKEFKTQVIGYAAHKDKRRAIVLADGELIREIGSQRSIRGIKSKYKEIDGVWFVKRTFNKQ